VLEEVQDRMRHEFGIRHVTVQMEKSQVCD
jgi:Co/Zn/Cd efflux system component